MIAVPCFFDARPSANDVRDDSCALAVLFPMTADALQSICWPDVFLWNWFQWVYLVVLFERNQHFLAEFHFLKYFPGFGRAIFKSIVDEHLFLKMSQNPFARPRAFSEMLKPNGSRL